MINAETKPICLSNYAILAMLFFLTVKALEGPIRFLLVSANIAWAIYIPTLLLFLMAIIRISIIMRTWRISRILLGVILALVIASCLGFMVIDNPFQVLFGVYVLIPFLFGIVMAPEIVPYLRRFHWFFVLLWFVSVSGVLMDYFFDWPWAGFIYDIVGISIEGVRKWSAFGIERLAGFARASFEAAIIIFILSLFLLSYGKNFLFKLIVWLVGGVAIVFTTTKGITAAYLAVTALLLIRPWTPAFMLRMIPYLVAITVIAIPLFSWTHDISLDLNNEIDRFLFASFEDRLSMVWPSVNELVSQYGVGPLGRGIGGIGAAQDRFEKSLFNPGDNLFVYLFGITGYFAVPVVLLIAHQVSRFVVGRCNEAKFFYFLGTGILFYGLTTNVVESSYMGMFLGIVVRYASCFRSEA